MKRYINQPIESIDPHIFSIADRAMRNLENNKVSQTIIISGG
jgi:myosin heavy subunit